MAAYSSSQQSGQLGTGGGVYYRPSSQGAVMMVPQAAPQYEYTPNDYSVFSIVTAVIFGICSPLSLMFTIPALILSRKSRIAAKIGHINRAVQHGMIAAHLNLLAIMFSFVAGLMATVIFFPLYYTEQCKGNDDY